MVGANHAFMAQPAMTILTYVSWVRISQSIDCDTPAKHSTEWQREMNLYKIRHRTRNKCQTLLQQSAFA